jgi:uncharacterized surface protein with fasciclin (FAS1) repeats
MLTKIIISAILYLKVNSQFKAHPTFRNCGTSEGKGGRMRLSRELLEDAGVIIATFGRMRILKTNSRLKENDVGVRLDKYGSLSIYLNTNGFFTTLNKNTVSALLSPQQKEQLLKILQFDKEN